MGSLYQFKLKQLVLAAVFLAAAVSTLSSLPASAGYNEMPGFLPKKLTSSDSAAYFHLANQGNSFGGGGGLLTRTTIVIYSNAPLGYDPAIQIDFAGSTNQGGCKDYSLKAIFWNISPSEDITGRNSEQVVKRSNDTCTQTLPIRVPRGIMRQTSVAGHQGLWVGK